MTNSKKGIPLFSRKGGKVELEDEKGREPYTFFLQKKERGKKKRENLIRFSSIREKG